jgi:hypothetical protein
MLFYKTKFTWNEFQLEIKNVKNFIETKNNKKTFEALLLNFENLTRKVLTDFAYLSTF